MHKERLQRLTLSGILMAAVAVLTYAIKLPVPTTGGYVHAGDGVIFLAALLLGPFAGLVGGLGSAIADLLGGYFIYLVPTFLIKAAMGAFVGAFARKGEIIRNVLVFLLAECIMVLGYFLFEGFALSWPAALAALGPNALQGAVGVLIGTSLTSIPLDALS